MTLPLPLLLALLLPLSAFSGIQAACTANTTSTTDLQALLTSGGAGYVLQLCQGQVYALQDVLNYTASEQEISTENYPTDSTRATLQVAGFNISTAVKATDSNLSGVKLRNVQIDGNRAGADIYTGGAANIEFGGPNSNQLVEYTHSRDPRGWSCLHIAEGPFECSNATIQNNDIGPCGSEQFQQWSDGISLSCQSSLVQNNIITDATDGGIVIFGAPFSTIRNNTIQVQTRTTLGGINLVDVLPWAPPGNYSNIVVQGNHINGGFATGMGNDSFGTNNASAMIKIGIAIGPEVWFNQQYGSNTSTGGVVEDNVLSGAFAFGMAIATTKNFVISNNSFANNVSFIGSYGPNCTGAYLTPHAPTALLSDSTSLTNVTVTLPPSSFYPTSSDGRNNLDSVPNINTFVNGTAAGLTCFIHPGTSDVAWPYGGGGVNAYNASASSTSTSTSASGSATMSSGQSASSSATKSSSAAKRGLRVFGGGDLIMVGAAIGLVGLSVVFGGLAVAVM